MLKSYIFKFFSFLTILFILSFSSCNNPVSPPETLNDLKLSFVSGSIWAGLMPYVPPDPDPIACQIVLITENKNKTTPLKNISITQADVYLNSTNERLGTISFSTNWNGQLAPMQRDTVNFTKIKSYNTLSNTPCNKYIYLNLIVRKDFFNSITFKTDSLYFGCVY